MSSSAAPIYLHFRLRLRSPAIVSTLSGDPNSACTQPFIPGGTLRGVVAARLLAKDVGGNTEKFRRLVLSGDVRYLHAYPELAGDRSLPCSLSWRSQKADPRQAVDLAAFTGVVDPSVDAEDFEKIWPEEALGPAPAPFVAALASGGDRELVTPRIGSRLHLQRDRVKGRPWKDRDEQPHGAIFAYEYLEAGQVFCGAIQVMPTAVGDIEDIKELLDAGPILVGRSRRAGYGGEAEIEFTGPSPREYENVSDAISRDVDAGAWFRAFLVSAYVGRDPVTGQIDPGTLVRELGGRLRDIATVQRTCWNFEVVGSFNRKWRLEVPQAQAVAAGAVLVLKATSKIPLALLQAIEHEGLGERRVEGFGRVLFLEHSEEHWAIRVRSTEDRAPERSDDSRADNSLSRPRGRQLDFLETRIVLAAARAELDRIAELDLVEGAQRRSTNSLLGRLRTLFRRAADEQSAQNALKNLGIWCSDDDHPDVLKKSAREKLDRCKMGEKSLRQWLRELAGADPGEVGWSALVKSCGNPSTLTGLTQRSYLTSPEVAEAVLHEHSALLRVYLIDAVLTAMARLNRRGAQ